MNKSFIEQVLHLLSKDYGHKKWHPDRDPVAVLVQTILSQNTSDRNSDRAFDSLLASFETWQDIADADTRVIARSIRIGGLADVKANYIKDALNTIKDLQGNFDLDFLRRLSLNEAREWLMQLPGVGMKTASCVLLFSLGIPALPVDTHVYRVSQRLGLIDNKISVNQAHIYLESIVPQNLAYEFHILLIEHGRKTCKARNPYCRRCALQAICPSSSLFSVLATG
ncbi:MAG: endonuclease III [Dehalococcoidia bacterium]